MTIIEAVRKYLEGCPLLNGGKLNVDFLPEEAATYSVNVVPVKPVVKAYLDGSSKRQFLFVFATRAYYGDHIRQQLDNLCLFDGLTSRTAPATSRTWGAGAPCRKWRSPPPAMFLHPTRTRHGIRSSASCPISRKEISDL